MQADVFHYFVIHDRAGFYLDINKILTVPLHSQWHQGSDGLITFESTWCPCQRHRLRFQGSRTPTDWWCSAASGFGTVTHC